MYALKIFVVSCDKNNTQGCFPFRSSGRDFACLSQCWVFAGVKDRQKVDSFLPKIGWRWNRLEESGERFACASAPSSECRWLKVVFWCISRPATAEQLLRWPIGPRWICIAQILGHVVVTLKCGVRIVSFGQGSSLLWTHTPRHFYSRHIALTQEGRSLVNDVCDCERDWRVRRGE